MARCNSSAVADPGISLTLGALRDMLGAIRASALLLTGDRRQEVDQRALLLQLAKSCDQADQSFAALEDAIMRSEQ